MSGSALGTPPTGFGRPLDDAPTARLTVVDRFRRRSLAGREYLWPMFLLVAIASGIVAFAFTRSLIPPGVDPGHWLSISYAYVGLPTAPDPTDRVLFYAPLLFPLLGGLVLLTGSPLAAVDVLAVLLIAGYGLSTVLLARRFLASGPLQVALVGLTVFAGTTIQMLFWGGYPNLLGFILINFSMVALLRFVRTRATRDGAIFYALIGLTFFAHDLSFAVLMAALAVAVGYLLLFGKLPVSFLWARINLVGLIALGAIIEGYGVATARLGISHPSYLSANPTAYVIDEVGELFAPLAHAPVYLPTGPLVYLPPTPTALLLAVAPLAALGGLIAVREYAPSRFDSRLILSAGWFAAALAVPGAGYLAHVDTDYSRFLYFLPLPFTLLALVAIERGAMPQLAPQLAQALAPTPGTPPSAAPAPVPPRRRRIRAPTIARVSVTVLLAFVLLFVTIPVALDNAAASTETAHDPAFLDAVHWIRASPSPGNVLTVQSAARWTEALSLRDATTVGPVWLLFDPFQIADAQEAYWALVSEGTVTNNHVALSYSGFATPVLSQAPMYSAYVEGVPFPVLRVLPGNLYLNASGPSSTQNYPLEGTSAPHLELPGASGGPVTITYQTQVGPVVETGVTLPDGSAGVRFLVSPTGGAVVHSIGVTLAPPPADSSVIATDTNVGVFTAGTTVEWNVSGKLGQYPTDVTVPTSVTFSEAPVVGAPVAIGAAALPLVFADPNGSAPFGLELRLASPGASNPTGELPPLLNTTDFLDAHAIHFLLWPNTVDGSVELAYYSATFGFRDVYQNSEWIVLER
ncbi:MAG: hypothetical protein L3J91_01900 [Thermoplasmata archaeon]|nr:hypothetical protein [Thermoplasmata archaeon]